MLSFHPITNDSSDKIFGHRFQNKRCHIYLRKKNSENRE